MYETEVKRGAAWLDVERPGWDEKVRLATLDLGDFSACVLGQVFGRAGASRLCYSRTPAAMACGFLLPTGSMRKADYAPLTEAWAAEIRLRQTARRETQGALRRAGRAVVGVCTALLMFLR